MSLILDALKKSEQERRRERAPDLQTIHQASASSPRAPRNNAVWIAALIAVNVLALGGWWWSQRGSQVAPEIATAPVADKAPAASTPPTPAESAPIPESIQPAPLQSRDDAQFTRIEPRANSAQPQLSASTPVEEFADLSPDVRSSLPAMTFSFHVYSADARNRTIIINNQRLREGEEVSSGVTLESITEDGVILAMDHRRVHINVLTGW